MGSSRLHHPWLCVPRGCPLWYLLLSVPIPNPSCPWGSKPVFPCSSLLAPHNCQPRSHTTSIKILQALLEKDGWIFIPKVCNSFVRVLRIVRGYREKECFEFVVQLSQKSGVLSLCASAGRASSGGGSVHLRLRATPKHPSTHWLSFQILSL